MVTELPKYRGRVVLPTPAYFKWVIHDRWTQALNSRWGMKNELRARVVVSEEQLLIGLIKNSGSPANNEQASVLPLLCTCLSHTFLLRATDSQDGLLRCARCTELLWDQPFASAYSVLARVSLKRLAQTLIAEFPPTRWEDIPELAHITRQTNILSREIYDSDY